MTKKQLSQFATTLISVIFLSVALFALRRQLEEYTYQDILNSLRNIPSHRILLALLLVALDYAVIAFYDVLALRYIRQPLSYPKIALTILISNAFSGLGLGVFAGSLLRYRFYSRWGITKLQLVQIIAFLNVGLWMGMLAISGTLLILEPLSIPDFIPIPLNSLQPLGALCLILVITYLLFSFFNTQKRITLRQFEFRIPPAQLTLAHILLLTVDWAVAAGVLFVLLYPAPNLSYPILFRNYLLAQVAGAVSNVPGGLGVVETTIILLLQPTVSADIVLASLLAFRGIHYFVPLVIAAILLSWDEIRIRFYDRQRPYNK